MPEQIDTVVIGCGQAGHLDNDWLLVRADRYFEEDQSLAQLREMPAGHAAERLRPGAGGCLPSNMGLGGRGHLLKDNIRATGARSKQPSRLARRAVAAVRCNVRLRFLQGG